MTSPAWYSVLTYDPDVEDQHIGNCFTPQKGVKTPVLGQAGLRRALRKLESMGYEVRGRANAVSVLVERIAPDVKP